MPGIPDSTIDEVRAASDLVDVVSDRVRLKKQGKNFMGLCPFHNEKSPSFSVDAAQNLYYCFGCLDEDEPVWTGRGLIRIGDVEVGDSVLGIDGVEERVADVWTKRAPVRELHLGAVRRDPLRLTGDHVCMVVPEAEAVRAVPMLYHQANRGVRFQSRKRSYRMPRPARAVERLAEDVRAGDYVLFPVVPDAVRRDAPLAAPLRPQAAAVVTPGGGGVAVAWPRVKGPSPRTLEALPVNERTARLFGLWLAEGSVYRGGVRWSFHRDEEPYAQFVADVLQTELGLPATIHRRPERTLTEVTCSSTHLSRLVPRHFGKGAAGKRVPWQALRWSSTVQRAFVEGYLDGDATRPGDGMATAVSVSESLVRGVFAVAVQADYVVSMGREGYRTSADRPLWRLTVRAQESADAFFYEAGGQRAYWLRVSANEATDDVRTVVDIETTGSHTFTTKLGAVHNCRRGGDVFKFVEEVEGVGFLDSVRLLADRAGITIPEEGAGPEADRKGTLLAALRFAAGFYFDQLKKPAGERALAYLKERGFTKEAVVAFGIGAAPDSWDALATAAEEAGFKPDVLEAVGLVKSRSRADDGAGGAGRGGHYDVFRDRLMFPILSPIGKVLGFGGRILPDTRTGSDDYTPAKYVNSPETEVYHKGRVLYGMKQAKRAIRTEREAIVVEGYADVVSLWQAGVRNVVAASGTALTSDQIRSLTQLGVERLVLVMDPDKAGLSAALKAIDVALKVGVSPYCVVTPGGQDADVFVQEVGLIGWKNLLAESKLNFVEVIIRFQKLFTDLYDTPEGSSRAVQYLTERVASIKDEVAAESYYRFLTLELSEMGIDEVVVRNQIGKEYNRRFSAVRVAAPPRPAPPRREPEDEEAAPGTVGGPPPVVRVRPEELSLLRLMLSHGPAMVEHVLTRMGTDEFTEGAPREAVEAIIAQFEAGVDGKPSIDPTPFVRGEHGDAVRGLVAEALSERHGLSENWQGKVGVTPKGRDDDPFASATSSMRLLKLDRVQEAVTAAMREVQVRERAGEDISGLQAEVNALNELRRQIERDEFLEWSE